MMALLGEVDGASVVWPSDGDMLPSSAPRQSCSITCANLRMYSEG